MVSVKFCGITRAKDAEKACELGCNFIGLNFVESSPRYVDLSQAAQIANETMTRTHRVGIFLDPSANQVNEAIEACDLQLLQFSGQITSAFCSQFDRPYIRSVRVSQEFDFSTFSDEFPDAWGYLLDAWKPGSHGGTGHVFDWDLWPSDPRGRMFLAGGLKPTNVFEAIQLTRPWAVDVASGIEIEPGVKDHMLMTEFMNQVKRAMNDERS